MLPPNNAAVSLDLVGVPHTGSFLPTSILEYSFEAVGRGALVLVHVGLYHP